MLKIVLGIFIIGSMLFLVAANVVSAQTTPGAGSGQTEEEGCSRTVNGVVYPCDPLSKDRKPEQDVKVQLENWTVGVINYLLVFLGAGAFVMFFYGGSRILFAAGDAGAVKKGQKAILYAVIGLAVIFLSYAILNFVFSVFGSLPGGGTQTENQQSTSP